MSNRSRARDLSLLDALDKFPRVSLHDTVWRVVRSEQDPLLCRPSVGRWDLGYVDVLYTSFEADGAVSEMYFHLTRQPVFPFTIQFTLNEIEVTTHSTLEFADIRDLEPLGVDRDKYPALLYERIQEIGDAAAFLGFDGVISPSARWNCLNLAIFCDGLSPEDLVLRNSTGIDWDVWRRTHGKA